MPVKDYGFIEVMIQKLSMNNFTPIDIGQIGQTLQYCEQRIDVITELLVKQYPTSSAENLLALLSAIRDVFDVISETGNNLENSLNGIVGCVDLVVLDVQIALQVLVEAFISDCDALAGTEHRSDEAITSAVYCLSSAIKMLLTSTSDLIEKISISTETIDANAVTGLQMIQQSILNIVDRVLYCVKRITILDLEDVKPSLEKVSLIIQRLATQRLNFVTKISPLIITPITDVLNELKSNVDQLPQMTRKNIDNLVTALASVEETVNERNISATITSLLDTLQPMLGELSRAIHSIHGITDAIAYSTDISLQNLMATIKCLAYYITVASKMLSMIQTTEIGGNLQLMLCFIASNIQTLVQGVTLAVERALIDLICMSPTIDKVSLEQQLLQLQASMEPIFLMLENVIKTSIELVQNILSLAASAMSDISPDLIGAMNMLINNLQRIVKNIMASALDTKNTAVDGNQIETDPSTVSSINSLSLCTTTFEAVAENAIKVKVYFNKSVDLIRRYLIQM